MQDSAEYKKRKAFYDKIITVFGRKPVLEALLDDSLDIHRVHLADSNKRATILDEIVGLAKKRGIEVCYHDKKALSRISKNAKQDQGAAIDVIAKGFSNADSILVDPSKPRRLIALDNVTNPQNLGMIIRSVAASPIDGLIIPEKGCAKLDSLVIKASAGTVFKAPIYRCTSLASHLQKLQEAGAQIIGLNVNASYTMKQVTAEKTTVVFVMGNESDGISKDVTRICTKEIAIPMNNGVESLNVAVTASLIAFYGAF